MASREEKKESKRRRILEAGRELFAVQGFEETTTRQLASQAGVANGTLFLYARDKVDLLLMLFIDDLRTTMETGFREHGSALPFVEQCVGIYSGFFRLYARNPRLGLRFVQETLFATGDRGDDYNRLNYDFAAALVERVTHAQARGELRGDIEPHRVAIASFAHYAIIVFEWLKLPEPSVEAAATELRDALGMLVEGVGSRTP
jgi:AcrR family transcriptional regulator